MRRIALGLVLALGLFLSIGGVAATGTASADGGYSPTVTNTSCWDGSATITISWNSMGSGPQYADYTYGGNFQAGTYYGMGPMSQWDTTVTITGLTPGAQVTIRINTTTGSGWTASKVITVTAPVCNTVIVTRPVVTFPVIVPVRPIFVPIIRPIPLPQPMPPFPPIFFPPYPGIPPFHPPFPGPIYPIQPLPYPY